MVMATAARCWGAGVQSPDEAFWPRGRPQTQVLSGILNPTRGDGPGAQLIHGDLHYDNVMVVDDAVSGLLDFEFCAYDWRAMELAVALSK
jgi:hypothetical protein